MDRVWKIRPKAPEEILQRFPELPGVVVQLLWNRGITNERVVDEFLSPDWSRDVHDPFLFRDMGKAVERLGRAIQSGEKITIHGDYDADGVCASDLRHHDSRVRRRHLGLFAPSRH